MASALGVVHLNEMKITHSFTLNTELYSSKNSRRILMRGKTPFVAKSANACKQETTLKWLLLEHKQAWRSAIKDMPKPLHVQFKVIRRTNGKFDLINIIQGLLDAMVAVEMLPDDNANEIIPYFEPHDVDKKNPRVIINLLSINA